MGTLSMTSLKARRQLLCHKSYRLCSMRNFSLVGGVAPFLLICSLILNIVLWFDMRVASWGPFANVCGVREAKEHEIRGQPDATFQSQQPPLVTLVNETQSELTRDLERWCRQKYPVENVRYVDVTWERDIPPYRMTVYEQGDVVSNFFVRGRVFENRLLENALLNYVTPDYMVGKVFVDVGANIGLYTIPALALGYVVVAFEPMESNLQLLRHSVCINGLSGRLQLHPFALGREESECWIVSRTSNRGNGITVCTEQERDALLNDMPGNEKRYEVRGTIKTVKLDDYLSTSGPVGLMKIDVEGFAGEALSDSGSQKLFGDRHRRPPVVFSELSHIAYGRGCVEGDGLFIQTMLGREYAMTMPGSNEYFVTLEAVCSRPPFDVVWVDRDMLNVFPVASRNRTSSK